MRNSVRSRVFVVALASAFAVAGCGSTATPTDSSTAEARTQVGGSEAAGAVGGDPAGAASGSPAGGGSGATDSSGGDTPSAVPKPVKPSATSGTRPGGPEIVYFRVRQQPSCPAGTNVNPVPGNPVVLEWKATNVDTVALSVDGPGIYGDGYPPTGSETLTFPCDGDEGSTQQHTYQLTVTNAVGKQTRTLTVSARVNGIAPV